MKKADILVTQYISRRETYESYTEKLEKLIYDLLKEERISIHRIDSRTKDKDSLSKKISIREDKYESLEDITDLSGLRIITYFSEDVDKVANLIEREFLVDKVNSIDKRKVIDADRFGYLSLHYVVEMHEDRLKLFKNRNFVGLKTEIQIRSILQHAWAEIEHDLGYKTEEKIPREIRRSFSRVAGLLETADHEFDSIREKLENYEVELQKSLETNPNAVYITNTSLNLLLQSDDSIQSLNKRMKIKNQIERDVYYLKVLAKTLKSFQIDKAGDLLFNLSSFEHKLYLFSSLTNLALQNCIEYLCVYLAAKNKSVSSLLQLFDQFSLFELENRNEEAKRIIYFVEGIENSFVVN